MLWGLLLLALVLWAGELVWDWDLLLLRGEPPKLRYLPIRKNHTVSVAPADSTSPPPHYQSQPGSFSASLVNRTSAQLDFRWLSEVVVLHFSCNFDVVVGGGEHSVYSAILTGSLNLNFAPLLFPIC